MRVELERTKDFGARRAIRNLARGLQMWARHRDLRELEVEFQIVTCDAERAIALPPSFVTIEMKSPKLGRPKENAGAENRRPVHAPLRYVTEVERSRSAPSQEAPPGKTRADCYSTFGP